MPLAAFASGPTSTEVERGKAVHGCKFLVHSLPRTTSFQSREDLLQRLTAKVCRCVCLQACIGSRHQQVVAAHQRHQSLWEAHHHQHGLACLQGSTLVQKTPTEYVLRNQHLLSHSF